MSNSENTGIDDDVGTNAVVDGVDVDDNDDVDVDIVDEDSTTQRRTTTSKTSMMTTVMVLMVLRLTRIMTTMLTLMRLMTMATTLTTTLIRKSTITSNTTQFIMTTCQLQQRRRHYNPMQAKSCLQHIPKLNFESYINCKPISDQLYLTKILKFDFDLHIIKSLAAPTTISSMKASQHKIRSQYEIKIGISNLHMSEICPIPERRQ